MLASVIVAIGLALTIGLGAAIVLCGTALCIAKVAGAL